MKLTDRIQNKSAQHTQKQTQKKERIESVRNQLNELIEKLENSTNPEEKKLLQDAAQRLIPQGSLKIKLGKITTEEDQARQTITEQEIKKRAQTLLDFNQLAPLIIAKRRDKNILLDGEVTFRAAEYLFDLGHREWGTLDFVYKETEETRHNQSLAHHQFSSGLNELDRVEAILREMRKDVPLSVSIEAKASEKERLIKNKYYKLLGSIRNLFENKKYENLNLKGIYEKLLVSTKDERAKILDQVEILNAEQKFLLSFLAKWQIPNISTLYGNFNLVFISRILKDSIRDKEQPISFKIALKLKNLSQEEQKKWLKIIRKDQLSFREFAKKLRDSQQNNKPQIKLKQINKSLAQITVKTLADIEEEDKELLIKQLKKTLALLEK